MAQTGKRRSGSSTFEGLTDAQRRWFSRKFAEFGCVGFDSDLDRDVLEPALAMFEQLLRVAAQEIGDQEHVLVSHLKQYAYSVALRRVLPDCDSSAALRKEVDQLIHDTGIWLWGWLRPHPAVLRAIREDPAIATVAARPPWKALLRRRGPGRRAEEWRAPFVKSIYDLLNPDRATRTRDGLFETIVAQSFRVLGRGNCNVHRVVRHALRDTEFPPYSVLVTDVLRSRNLMIGYPNAEG